MSVDELYEQQIKLLSRADRLRLLTRIAQELVQPDEQEPLTKRNILELHGLGANIWQGIDAQEYVDDLRKEWDHRNSLLAAQPF